MVHVCNEYQKFIYLKRLRFTKDIKYKKQKQSVQTMNAYTMHYLEMVCY